MGIRICALLVAAANQRLVCVSTFYLLDCENNVTNFILNPT